METYNNKYLLMDLDSGQFESLNSLSEVMSTVCTLECDLSQISVLCRYSESSRRYKILDYLPLFTIRSGIQGNVIRGERIEGGGPVVIPIPDDSMHNLVQLMSEGDIEGVYEELIDRYMEALITLELLLPLNTLPTSD